VSQQARNLVMDWGSASERSGSWFVTVTRSSRLVSMLCSLTQVSPCCAARLVPRGPTPTSQRSVGRLRRERLRRMLIFQERQLVRVQAGYARHYTTCTVPTDHLTDTR